MIVGIAYIAYTLTGPYYHVGDAFKYYEENTKKFRDIVDKNKNRMFDTKTNEVHIDTEDNLVLYIQQCIDVDWDSINKSLHIQPILFVSGGPGIPPQKCPLFLSLLTDKLNSNDGDYYYIPYIYHQRGTGRSSRIFADNQTFPDYEGKAAAGQLMHEYLGFHQQILDIERIRKYLIGYYGERISKDVKANKISLIGHSFGAVFSSLYAAEFTKNVNRIILIAGAPVLDFKVFFAKYDIFKMIRSYLPENKVREFDLWKMQYMNSLVMKTMAEPEMNKVHLKFLDYFKIAQTKHLESKYPDYKYGTNICDEQNDEDEMDINLYGGWMTSAVYYEMGMWHFWANTVKNKICNSGNNNIKGLVLHCDHDLQEIEASFEYAKIFECNNKNKDMLMKDVIPEADHTVVYHDKAECVMELVDKISKRF